MPIITDCQRLARMTSHRNLMGKPSFVDTQPRGGQRPFREGVVVAVTAAAGGIWGRKVWGSILGLGRRKQE